MVDVVKVISLERSRERRALFSERNRHLNFEFFPAVDGEALTPQELSDPDLFLHPLPFPGRGAYGCALSHRRLWALAARSGIAQTVAEDDAVFRADFSQAAARMLEEMPAGWDLVLWGWNFDGRLSIQAMPGVSPVALSFSQSRLREGLPAFQRQPLRSTLYRLDACFGIPAYTISPGGAEKFLSGCFPMKNEAIHLPVFNKTMANVGIDVSMNRLYPRTDSFVAFPPLVVSENRAEDSTVQNPSGTV